ncbi:CT214 family putative inclusion membrane protein [Chlamydia avium]|uniref:Uncharacterized protein n=1 Tax=Chlamydia avium 10DC88 TaxID=1229831 RepID=W8JF66_9CHLA|nr:hypothetical protein [Chlamydia avium]AHK63181.1 Uncharacterized protein M832_03160 [Chlamydia avium 10DC88]
MPNTDCFLSRPVVVDAHDKNRTSNLVESNSIRQAQIIGLITGIIASVLLLITLLLFIIPSVPVACVIVSGSVLCLLTTISLVAFATYFIKIRRVLSDLTEVSADLRARFIDCSLDLARDLGCRGSSQQVRDSVCQPLSPSDKGVIADSQPSSISSYIPEESLQSFEQITSVLEEKTTSDVKEELFVKSCTKQLLSLSRSSGPLPSFDQLPNYKKEQTSVSKQFTSCCIGLTNFIDKLNKGELPLSAIEAVSMFFRPFMGCDSHSVLRITCNAKDLFLNRTAGCFWLNNVLTRPETADSLLALLQLLKTLPNSRRSYPSSLKLLNFLFTGWCLANVELYPYIVGSMQKLSATQEQRDHIVELLASGNVLGALCFLHGQTREEWKEVLILPEDTSQPVGARMSIQYVLPMESVSLTYLRRMIQLSDSKPESEKQAEKLAEELHKLLSKLSQLLPSNILGLVANIARKDSPLSRHMSELERFFDRTPTPSLEEVVSIVKTICDSKIIQTRLQSYLPYAGKDSLGSILSTLALGGLVAGVFTKKQMVFIAHSFGLSVDQLEDKILKGEIAKVVLPLLFG